jgi:hypothetical protein
VTTLRCVDGPALTRHRSHAMVQIQCQQVTAGPCFHVGVVDLGDDGAMVRELPVRGGRRPTGDDTTVSASLGECIARALSATIPRVADPSQ